MAIKVIITRKVTKGKENDLLPLLVELRAKAMEQKGYISGETLKGISAPAEFIVISTWNGLGDWNSWVEMTEKRTTTENYYLKSIMKNCE